ncbi:MAG: hypothetical protein M1826_000448 [Phylliscum demangeonii]|nr:MAG: hypothetical protein M1826_000448 [Phylliscum demangeonii]
MRAQKDIRQRNREILGRGHRTVGVLIGKRSFSGNSKGTTGPSSASTPPAPGSSATRPISATHLATAKHPNALVVRIEGVVHQGGIDITSPGQGQETHHRVIQVEELKRTSDRITESSKTAGNARIPKCDGTDRRPSSAQMRSAEDLKHKLPSRAPSSRPSKIGPPFTGHFDVYVDSPRGLQPFQSMSNAVGTPGKPLTSTERALAAGNANAMADMNLELRRNEIKFGDNDRRSAITAAMVQADYLFLMTDVACLYDQNPRTHADARPIEVVADIASLDADVLDMVLGNFRPLASEMLDTISPQFLAMCSAWELLGRRRRRVSCIGSSLLEVVLSFSRRARTSSARRSIIDIHIDETKRLVSLGHGPRQLSTTGQRDAGYDLSPVPGDVLGVGAIGAQTTESQLHRELARGLRKADPWLAVLHAHRRSFRVMVSARGEVWSLQPVVRVEQSEPDLPATQLRLWPIHLVNGSGSGLKTAEAEPVERPEALGATNETGPSKAQFSGYRAAVKEVLDDRLETQVASSATITTVNAIMPPELNGEDCKGSRDGLPGHNNLREAVALARRSVVKEFIMAAVRGKIEQLDSFSRWLLLRIVPRTRTVSKSSRLGVPAPRFWARLGIAVSNSILTQIKRTYPRCLQLFNAVRKWSTSGPSDAPPAQAQLALGYSGETSGWEWSQVHRKKTCKAAGTSSRVQVRGRRATAVVDDDVRSPARQAAGTRRSSDHGITRQLHPAGLQPSLCNAGHLCALSFSLSSSSSSSSSSTTIQTPSCALWSSTGVQCSRPACVRIALTCRFVQPELVAADQHWKAHYQPDPRYDYAGDWLESPWSSAVASETNARFDDNPPDGHRREQETTMFLIGTRSSGKTTLARRAAPNSWVAHAGRGLGLDEDIPHRMSRNDLRTLCTIQHFRDRLAATVALDPYVPPGVAPSTEVMEGGGPDDPKKSALSQQEVNSLEAQQDEERWAKLKALKKAFEFKRLQALGRATAAAHFDAPPQSLDAIYLEKARGVQAGQAETMVSCRLVGGLPTVMAEITFEERRGASTYLATFTAVRGEGTKWSRRQR